MSQTTVQSQSSVRFGSGKLLIDGVDIGLLNDAKAVIAESKIQVRAHNGLLPPRAKIESIKFSAVMLELNLTNIAKIDGHGVLSSVAGVATPVTQEVLKTGAWAIGTPLKIANKNGANTVVSSIVVKAGATYGAASTLALTTNYTVYVGDGVNGTLGYTYITPVTANAGNIYVDYSYTPNVSKKITWSDISKLITTYSASFENVDENGKTFKIVIPAAYSSGNLDIAFASDDEISKTAEMPIELTAYPDGTNRLMYIEDEQAAT